MLLFNCLLIIHFTAFLLYVAQLALLYPKIDSLRDKKGLIAGIIILLTGIGMVIIKYPHVNYYKVVPKTGIFLMIAIINALYSKREFTKPVYYLLVVLTLLASLIAIVKV
ncbi:hypothetical protein ACX0G9_20220 [Flavitalea flava]